ncbi:hypothetical protein D187_006001 [Cystobacter fuscus DSM 2262]|uniref:Uncharacterized protein n=1 Tax=Cystobacter fuscus (strain ATCC 25194 / DSM 2262 / NBRC 100088 / M29) TaxID=1242864 RepID=S9R3Y6_CYSF2|nr:hypothetical protein [Cystobacter fuscus]EPX63593.1 hypothetical protein D187_006001 [Cystobacter fuscus DSM 2262]
MRIGQKQPSVSGQEMKAREAAPTATSQATHPTPPAAAQPRKAGGEARFQSKFGAPVRRNASAKAKNFVTPPPPGHTSAQASAMGDDELRQALDAAHELIHGGKASGSQVDDWMARARELASEHGNDFDAVKYALHSEMFSKTQGTSAPSSPANHTQGDSGLRTALNEAYELVHGGKPSGPKAKALMARAKQLASEGNDLNDIKYTLHAEILSEKTGQKITHNKTSGDSSYAQMALKSQILNSAMSPGGFSSGGMSMGDPLSYAVNNHARQSMQNQLFGKMATVKSSAPPAPMSNTNLRRAVDDAHQLAFGQSASGTSANELMAQAQGLAGQHHNNFKVIQLALHALMIGMLTPPAGETPAPLSKDKLHQALDEAHTLVFGKSASGTRVDTWMAKAGELASQLKNDFNAVKFALHGLLSGKPLPAPGAKAPPPSDTELRQALDDTHQVVFKEAANGPHLNAWMAEARKLAGQHDNNLDTVKFFLHSQMLELK